MKKSIAGLRTVFARAWKGLRSFRLFVLHWLASTGLIATTTVCPYCGNQGCAVGVGQATVLGAIIAGVLRLVTGKRKEKAADDAHKEAPTTPR